MPQPYLVPVKPRLSRKTHSRGVEGSTSRFTRCRFTLKEIIGTPPLTQEADEIVKAAANLTPICQRSRPITKNNYPRLQLLAYRPEKDLNPFCSDNFERFWCTGPGTSLLERLS